MDGCVDPDEWMIISKTRVWGRSIRRDVCACVSLRAEYSRMI